MRTTRGHSISLCASLSACSDGNKSFKGDIEVGAAAESCEMRSKEARSVKNGLEAEKDRGAGEPQAKIFVSRPLFYLHVLLGALLRQDAFPSNA